MLRTVRNRYKRHFGIAAPRLAVRRHIPWYWRGLSVLALLALLAGVSYTGFDLGRIFAGFNHPQMAAEQERLQAEVEKLRQENETLRADSTRLASAAKVAEGSQAVLSKQVRTLQTENTQLKEEQIFLQRLIAGAGKEGAISIPRFEIDRTERPAEYRYRALVVQGGNRGEEYRGRLQLQVTLMRDGAPTVLNLPEQQPDLAPALQLSFKQYQRLEGVFKVPESAQVKMVHAKVIGATGEVPKATASATL